MKRLNDILPLELQTAANPEISGLTLDSRAVLPDFLFAAIRGTQSDGHLFIEKAIASGARAILCEYLPERIDDQVIYIQTSDVMRVLGACADNFYDQPSAKMNIVGVTGTNGKTTIATLLYRLYNGLGYNCGLISTVENKIGSETIPATHTTPDVVTLHGLFNRMADSGCSHVFMEVSSHALDQQRVASVRFAGAVFTNLTHDHLDYHGSFEHYRDSKKKLFDHLDSTAFALTNRDDRNGAFMIQNCKASKYGYALRTGADFKGKLIEQDFDGMLLSIDNQEAWYHLTGTYNASNLLAVYGVAFLMGENPEDVIRVLTTLRSVSGRFETVRSESGITAIVDYAHTPDALKNILETITGVRTRNEQLITIVGCGGNRDKEKRPNMAAIASQFSDRAIFTSDNPRDEEAADIIRDMMQGVPPQYFKKVTCIENRAEAIKLAVSMCKRGDIILVAGKGHEKYQEIKGVKHPFDDREHIENSFRLYQS